MQYMLDLRDMLANKVLCISSMVPRRPARKQGAAPVASAPSVHPAGQGVRQEGASVLLNLMMTATLALAYWARSDRARGAATVVFVSLLGYGFANVY
jgi:hypothetical protein